MQAGSELETRLLRARRLSMFNHARVIAIFLAIVILAATPSLQASWPSDGRAICTVPGTQDTPVIVADGLGGAIIAWTDQDRKSVV